MIQATTKDAYKLIHDGALALARAERQGIRVDINYCAKRKKSITKKIARKTNDLKETKLYKKWRQVYGTNININSNDQLSKILYNTMGIKASKTTASDKQGATDIDALSQINEPGIDSILAIRKLQKVRDTYLEAFVREQTNGFIHPFFNLHTVRTFRSSSDRPNFQNIPKRDEEAKKICRKALFPRHGHQLLEVDFSGLEVSIAACYHKDPTMIKYLKDSSTDMHGDMAEQIFMIDDFDKHKNKEHKLLRNASKNSFIFPQFYGDYYGNNAIGLCKWAELPQKKWKNGMGITLPSGISISEHLRSKGINSFKDFLEYMKKIEEHFWNERFPVYKKWKEKLVKEYIKKGYIKMYTGFTCSGVMRKNEVINYLVQGAAFHCLLWSFIEIDKRQQQENWDSKLIGQIHDAVIGDIHPDELDYVGKTIHTITCKELPKAWDWIIVPLEVEADLCDVDASWADKKEYQL